MNAKSAFAFSGFGRSAGWMLIITIGMLLLNFSTVFAGFRRLGGPINGPAWLYEVIVCEDGVRYELAANLSPAQTATSTAEIIVEQGATELLARTGITLTYLSTPVVQDVFDFNGDGTDDNYIAYAYGLLYIPYTNAPNLAQTVDISLLSTQNGGNQEFGVPIDDCSIDDPSSMPPLNFNPGDPDAGDRGFDPRDGRSNRDAHATAAIYCQDDGSIHIYAINNSSQGVISFVVTPEEIAAVGLPEVNTVIDSGASAFGEDLVLYRLTTGEFQLSGPALPPETAKGYTFIWDGCG